FHESTEVLGPARNQRQPSPAQVAEMRHGYFANVSYLDAQVGRLLDALGRSGVAERTIVVFLSDHGYHIGEHALWGKTTNFELDARVPLLVHVPGVSRNGARTAALAELVDLFPTLVDACGLDRPPHLEGASLVPVLRDPSRTVKMAAFTQHPRPASYDRTPTKRPEAMGVSVRTPEARYTEWRDWTTGAVVGRELYSDADEPAETVNIVEQAEARALTEACARVLRTQFPEEATRP
ncbi:MAG: DUF229 domain-containing protein, partial [Planctomycetia bacterium]|nr:DUF229 domain-containing protein [Planctomycetia bacterium]